MLSDYGQRQVQREGGEEEEERDEEEEGEGEEVKVEECEKDGLRIVRKHYSTSETSLSLSLSLWKSWPSELKYCPRVCELMAPLGGCLTSMSSVTLQRFCAIYTSSNVPAACFCAS